MKPNRLGPLRPRFVWFIASFDGPPHLSKQLLELLDRQPCILGYAAHGVGIHGVVARDGDDAAAIGHDDVLALASDLESGLLKGFDSLEVWDAGDLGHYTATSTSRTSAP